MIHTAPQHTAPHATTDTPMTMTCIDTGITALITLLHNSTYSVRIRDDDSMNILPGVRIYKTYQEAYDYAYQCTALC